MSLLPIPTAYQAPCELCGITLDTRALGVCQWTAGWVKQRARGGHGIAVAGRTTELRWAHGWCVENPALIRQRSLF